MKSARQKSFMIMSLINPTNKALNLINPTEKIANETKQKKLNKATSKA